MSYGTPSTSSYKRCGSRRPDLCTFFRLFYCDCFHCRAVPGWGCPMKCCTAIPHESNLSGSQTSQKDGDAEMRLQQLLWTLDIMSVSGLPLWKRWWATRTSRPADNQNATISPRKCMVVVTQIGVLHSVCAADHAMGRSEAF